VHLTAEAVNNLLLLPAGTDYFLGVVLVVMMTGQLVATKGSLARAVYPLVADLRWGWHRCRQFIQPMLKCLGRTLRERKGVGVGVIQRTSVLATNRLVARVDPRASAELSLGEEQNLLQALQQIAQLSLAAQTGNALGVLGAFQARTGDEPQPEIYGISTGNAFQVTPIFDPTGQALRFRFDFVGATRIREPDDTRNPRLARIERHSVNTEVQLGNLEIREVSRFEANARLGLPTRYWGGLPILKDIPGLRPVPFIGWFIRRGGKAAVTQQSLIFAQTTMSPTIGDILELLDSSILPGNNNQPKE
jgi:hypothetical protein